MSTFSIAIVAHPKRAEHAQQLATITNAAHISLDTTKQGCDRNHTTTWTWHQHNTTTTWAVVLEDDALPVPDFTHQLEQALAVAPAPIISLYLGKQRPSHWQPAIAHATTQATHTHAHWITTDTAIHAVGLAIRTHHIPQMLQQRPTHRPTDEALTKWAQRNKHPIAYTWPSLIDHADLDTLVKHVDGLTRTPGRTAWHTGTHTQWNNTSVHMPNPRTWTHTSRTA